MRDLVQYHVRASVAVITIDNPPVNALSAAVAQQLERLIQHAAADTSADALVVIGAGSTFIGGADINEFGEIVAGQLPPLNLLPTLLVIEDCPKPVVMALHGAALGGGLETAMAGHFRVIASNASVGQPEVKLGLIPGAGGTQRLPRLAGVRKALEMASLGEPITAQDALSCGIADELIDGDLLTEAIAFAHSKVGRPILKTRNRTEKLNPSPESFDLQRAQVKKTLRQPRAALAAIDAIEAAVSLSFEEGCNREAALFRDCLYSNESKALIHVFFGERTVAKIPGISRELKALPVNNAAIIGAGTMGAGIAMAYANAGIPVRLKDATPEALERGIAGIRKSYGASVAKGRLSAASAAQRLDLIKPQMTYDGFEQADIITEAVFENLMLKKKIFSELDAIAKPDCLLATNTSSLDIDQMAAVTARPEMVIGTHFFSPAHVMRLLEVVRGKASSDLAIVSAMALGKRLGKVAVLVGNCFGFIGNRMVDQYLRQAYFLLEEGATVEQVNQALYDFGMAMGPLAMDDLSGIDIGQAIRSESAHLQSPEARQPLAPGLVVANGWLGQKTGRGWSLYDDQRKPSPNPEVTAILQQVSSQLGIKHRAITDQEIVDRCIGALVREGRKILEEGIALRAVDIDITYVYGYGFPAWRGGPMFYGTQHKLAE